MKLKTFARRAAAAGAVLAALTLAALPALAAPKVQVSTTNAVADHADILSDETEQYVNDVSIKLSDACGAQIGVYTLDELLGSTTMEGFAYDVFNAWGLGSDDLDNGVLLLLAPNEADGGDYYIMRGDGLESQLSFSTLGSLLDEYMEPYWVNGDYDTGTQKTVQALANRLCSIYGVTLNSSYTDTSAPDKGGPNVMRFVLLVVAVLLVIWLITYLMRPRGPRPPHGGGGGSSFGNNMFWYSMGRASRRPRRPPPLHRRAAPASAAPALVPAPALAAAPDPAVVRVPVAGSVPAAALAAAAVQAAAVRPAALAGRAPPAAASVPAAAPPAAVA
ncbi:MAG: TPM domain-containing protein [Gemmiger formicilis]